MKDYQIFYNNQFSYYMLIDDSLFYYNASLRLPLIRATLQSSGRTNFGRTNLMKMLVYRNFHEISILSAPSIIRKFILQKRE